MSYFSRHAHPRSHARSPRDALVGGVVSTPPGGRGPPALRLARAGAARAYFISPEGAQVCSPRQRRGRKRSPTSCTPKRVRVVPPRPPQLSAPHFLPQRRRGAEGQARRRRSRARLALRLSYTNAEIPGKNRRGVLLLDGPAYGRPTRGGRAARRDGCTRSPKRRRGPIAPSGKSMTNEGTR